MIAAHCHRFSWNTTTLEEIRGMESRLDHQDEGFRNSRQIFLVKILVQ
jgi:hypothetical protein